MKPKRRLIWQIFPSYLLITLLSLLAVSWFASLAFRSFFLEQTAADLKARAFLLEEQFGPLLVPLNSPEIDALCKGIGKKSQTRISIILPNGVVAGDSEEDPAKMENHAERPEIVTALAGGIGRSTRYSRTLKKKMMYMAVPLRKKGTVSGVLRTSIPVTAIDAELRAIQMKIALGGLLIGLVAAGLGLYVSRRITQPIAEMKQGAVHFARGDLNRRLPSHYSEEMSSLADVLNRMAADLDKRIKTINRQRNEMEAVLSSMTEGVVAVDQQARIISINQAAIRLFNCPQFDLHQHPIQEVIRYPDLNRFVEKALSRPKVMAGDIILFEKEERILHAKSAPLKDSDDRHMGTLIVLNDVTQLRRLERMRKDFAANVSHELKTPLTAIKGFVETLLHGALEDQEEAKRFLGIIAKHVNRLAAILEDLMNLSKIEQADEKKEISFELKPLIKVLHTAIGLCQDKAKAKQIEIRLACEPEIKVQMDPTLLEQAFFNLLDNAVNYSPEKSAVEVQASQNGTEIVVGFRDYGIGIPQKHVARLFERFYRVDKARSRKLGGTGLGLAIVKHIVWAHNGRVAVESTPGQGSLFTVFLPKP